jgi:hypothetical protein
MVYWYSTPDDASEFGAWSNRIKWCEKYCKGSWRYKLQGKFQFYDKEDYTLFLLCWDSR